MNTNKAKHTPGPWKYRPDKYDDWGVVKSADGYPVVQACLGRWTSEFDTHRTNKTDPAEANARLISAAPELLAALENIVIQMNNYGSLNNLSWEGWEKARAAISKAKGDK